MEKKRNVPQVLSLTLSLKKTMLSEEKKKKQRWSFFPPVAYCRTGYALSVFKLTCDDGGGLTSDLVLVHVLSIVQFPLHENSRPGSDGGFSKKTDTMISQLE